MHYTRMEWQSVKGRTGWKESGVKLEKEQERNKKEKIKKDL